MTDKISSSDFNFSLPKIELLILQPTGFCNINCSYCYLPHRNSKAHMSLETIANAVQWLNKAGIVGDTLSVVWHAGEPLVLPISYYEKAIAAVSENTPDNVVVSHNIQTNGILLDQNWCNFIRMNDISLGVSIDGPAFLHDLHRRTRSGQGTFNAAMNCISLLKNNEIDFHVITVLSRTSLLFPDEIFDFLVSNEIHDIGFNIEEIEGTHTKSSLQCADIEFLYQAFMKRFLHLAKRKSIVTAVREFRDLASFILAERSGEASDQQNTPFSILSVDTDGNISTFSPELLGMKDQRYGDFVFGNVNNNTPLEVFENQNLRTMMQDISAGVSQCRKSCSYFSLCGGGAPSNKLFENGSLATTETLYCRLTKKALVDIVLADLEETLETIDQPGH